MKRTPIGEDIAEDKTEETLRRTNAFAADSSLYNPPPGTSRVLGFVTSIGCAPNVLHVLHNAADCINSKQIF